MPVHPAVVVVEAVRLASEANILPLRQLIAHHPQTLDLQLVLRIILTYLPESIEPRQYTGLLLDLQAGNLNAFDYDTPLTSTTDLSNDEAQRRVRKLRLLPLTPEANGFNSSVDGFDSFLLERARRIEHETGSLPLIQQLVEPFLHQSQSLRTWAISTLLPLLRLDYEYYPQKVPAFSLESFERLRGMAGVNALLLEARQRRNAEKTLEIGRDLRGLVGPWIYGDTIRKRRKLGDNAVPNIATPAVPQIEDQSIDEGSIPVDWALVNEWLVELATSDFPEAVAAVEQWGGPGDVDYAGWDDGIQVNNNRELVGASQQYAQAALAINYSTRETSSQALRGIESVIDRVAHLTNLYRPPIFKTSASDLPTSMLSEDYILTLSQGDVLHNNLLTQSNPTTKPSNQALELLSLLKGSAQILNSLNCTLSIKDILTLCLFSSEIEQRTALRKVLSCLGSSINLVDKMDLGEIRMQLLWLRSWNGTNQDQPRSLKGVPHGPFCKISNTELETEILKTLLAIGRYELSIKLYCNPSLNIIPRDQVEKAVLDAAFVAYDNASNGNRTRGGVKKATEIVAAFGGCFPQSKPFAQVAALLRATHALSFYSLTLQHGVPLKPVSIRAQSDSISLIDKVLIQNPNSYTKLEDLLDIGRDLVRAGLMKPDENKSETLSEDSQLLIMERRIIAKAIEASLTEEDFETAYSYVVNRLSPSTVSQQSAPAIRDDALTAADDVTWRAAYTAGRYESKNINSPTQIRRLEQKMELLSLAIILAPPSSLEKILATWRDSEENLNQALAQEIKEERQWDERGAHDLPGGFAKDELEIVMQRPREPVRNAMNEEAPMGLFDVARGAAAALSKSAFPLRGPGATEPNKNMGRSGHQRNVASIASSDGDRDSLSGVDGEARRVRKRDMVSSMVTGGLASGIGWVLGAPPVQPE